MTTRYNSLKVVFDREIREDDLKLWIDAIRLLEHVIEVIPGDSGFEHEVAKLQARNDLRNELREVLWNTL